MGSSRFPGKVLRSLNGAPLLQYLVERVTRCPTLAQVVVATSTEAADDAIEDFCREHDVPCFRGSEDHVARRLGEAAATHSLDALVRVCADSPLLDPALVDRAVEAFRDQSPDLVTNVFPRSFPPGQSVEVVGTETLGKAVRVMEDPEDREHVTRWFYHRPDKYRIHRITSSRDYGDLDLAVDTPEDLDRLSALVARLERPHWEYGLDELTQAL